MSETTNEPEEEVTTSPASGVLQTVKSAGTAKATLRDRLTVTWMVPEESIRERVPESLTLDRLPGPDGTLHAFVQVTFALRLAARWAPLPALLGDSFPEASVRVLVRRDTKPGAFLLKNFVGNQRVARLFWPMTSSTEIGHFTVTVGGDPARKHFEYLSMRVVADSLQLQVKAVAQETPEKTSLGRWDDAVRFLTQREVLYLPARLPKEGLVALPQSLENAGDAVAASVTLSRVRPLEPLTLGEPILTVYQPEVLVSTASPRPLK